MTAPSIEKLREKKEVVQRKRRSLIESMEQIEKQLSEVFSDMDIFASGKDITLESQGIDDYVYGHFTYGSDGLAVAFRATDEDFFDHMNQVPEEYRGYKMRHFSVCKTTWLERLASSEAMPSLLTNIDKQLDIFNSTADTSIDVVKSVLEHQAAGLNEDVIDSLAGLGSESLSRDWVKARRLITLEPSESITRSSSYLESVCKYILNDVGTPLPTKETISELIKVCLQRVPLSEDKKAGDALQQLVGTLKGIFNSIGAIRNNYATAHGAAPGSFGMGEHEAQLVNNAAATVSIFLLHRHAVWKRSQSKD